MNLVERVRQDRAERGDAVPASTGGSGQVDHEGASRDSRDSPGQNRRRNTCGDSVVANRFRQAWGLALDHAARHLGSDVLRSVASTARGHDHIESLGDSLLERSPKRLAVGNDAWSGNLQPEVLQSFHKDGPGRVLSLASRGTVRRSDDKSAIGHADSSRT